MKKRCYAKLTVLLAGLVIIQVVDSIAQINTIARQHEPIIMTGQSFADFDGAPIQQLSLYSYDASNSTWMQIPFQIDERTNFGNFAFPPDSVDQTAGFDANDELVFMASDLGDRAPVWIDDPNSKQFVRYEIAITDAANPNDIKTGWAYLFQSTTITIGQPSSYVEYVPSPNQDTGQDTVIGVDPVLGKTYKLAGTDKGLFGYLSIPSVSEQNLFDREKIRGKSTNILFRDFNEESGFTFIRLQVIAGPVRIIRNVTLSLLGLVDAPLPFQYFRNSVFLGGTLTIVPLPLNTKITLLRHSIDLSSAASGMQFYNPNNTAILVDGASDANINPALELLPEINWTLITGEQGTIASLFQIPEIGDNQQLYYKDNAQFDSEDTGDGLSYGDSGILITGQEILGEFPLALKAFFFGPNQPSSLGAELAMFEENPLTTETTAQDAGTVAVEIVDEEAGIPKTFALQQNFPNPFNPSTVIKYQVPANLNGSELTLKIYNLLGQEIRTLVNKAHASGFYNVTWDGKDHSGRQVPAGVYIYQLKAGAFVDAKKMVLVK